MWKINVENFGDEKSKKKGISCTLVHLSGGRVELVWSSALVCCLLLDFCTAVHFSHDSDVLQLYNLYRLNEHTHTCMTCMHACQRKLAQNKQQHWQRTTWHDHTITPHHHTITRWRHKETITYSRYSNRYSIGHAAKKKKKKESKRRRWSASLFCLLFAVPTNSDFVGGSTGLKYTLLLMRKSIHFSL